MRLFPNAGFAVVTYTSPMQLCLAYEASGVWAHESRRMARESVPLRLAGERRE